MLGPYLRGHPALKHLAILANGASVADHDLSLISCPVMTVNRAWELRWPDHHVCLEEVHATRHPEVYQRLHDEGRLWVTVSGDRRCEAGSWLLYGKRIGHRLTRLPDSEWWSNDLTEGIVAEVGGVGSVMFAALQIAAGLGYTDLHCLGLDLGGPHFHGEWAPSPNLTHQNRLFKIARLALDKRGVCCHLTGSPESLCDAFPHETYGEFLAALGVSVNFTRSAEANGNAEGAGIS